MRTWKDVATLVKTKNLNGRFVACSAASLPFLLEVGLDVAFVPPQNDLPRNGKVDFVREASDGSYEVGFDTVRDESSARALVGSHCLMRRADIDEALLEESCASWEGWLVTDVQGASIGEVVDMRDAPGQSLLEVDRGGGLPLSYIPVVDEFIVEVDEDMRRIVVDLPEGLLTLNDPR